MKTKLLALLSLMAMSAFSATWPSGPIKIVVPYTPGGITDDLARSVGNKLAAELNAVVFYEYKPGGSGIIGANYVAKAKPDGHTFLVASNSFTISGLAGKLPYDPLKDFSPVSLLAVTPAGIVVNSNLPVSSFNELVKFAQENPYKINYSTSGIGSMTHLTMEKAQQQGNFKMTHVPYKGQTEAWTDFLGGRMDVMIDAPAAIAKYLDHKNVKVIALTSETRLDLLPGVQTVSESKLNNFTAVAGFMLVAPPGTSDKIVETVSRKIADIVNSSDFKHKFAPKGMIPVGSTPADTAKFIADEVSSWKKVSDKVN